MKRHLPIHLERMEKSQLESLCVDCGICCRPAVPVAKGINAVVPELRCKHLATACDGKTSCGVYSDRLSVAKGWCFDLADAIEKGLFPDACPYVKDIPGYNGTTILNDRAYQMIRPQIKQEIVSKGMPPWVDSADWKSFVDGD